MLENQFSQFGEIHLQFPHCLQGAFFIFSYFLAVYICTTACDRDHGTGRGGAGGRCPNFSPQMQFLTAFLKTIGLPNPEKLPELQLKFDYQTTENRTIKIS